MISYAQITRHFDTRVASKKIWRYRFFSELPVLPRVDGYNSYRVTNARYTQQPRSKVIAKNNLYRSFLH
jgi:hypothetical protein